MDKPASTATCARCGTPLDRRSLNGLCPRCLALDFFAPAAADSAPEATAPPGEPGRRVGDYELLEEIARGGMGVVYRARQISLNREVAVKMLLHGVLAGDPAIARFKAEAAIVAHLRHPNIVAIHEIGEHQGQHYFSMDFVVGSTLAAKVRDGPLPARQAAAYLQRVAEAVQYAHEHGVLHRDLKPSNILVDEHDQPRVTDFGVAKRADAAAELTLTGQVLGTPAYLPPEQADTKKFGPVEARSDVYALGAILYHLLTGRAPFTGDSLTETLHQVTDSEPIAPRLLNPKLPRDLETICLNCLAKEPHARYASAQALADDLARFLRGEVIIARPAGPLERIWRWCRRKPALASTLGACVVILAAGVTGMLWQLTQTEAARREAVQKAEAEQVQRKLAQESELVMRQNLYAADMMAAQRALDRNDLGTARLLLNGHRPRLGQEDLRGFEWRYLWKLAQGDQCVVLTNATGPVGSLAFSPDGRWLALAGPEVIVCDAATRQERARVKVVSQSIAFARDSSALLITDWETWAVRRWDWEKGSPPAEFIPPAEFWPHLVVSPSGDTVAVGRGNDIITSSEGLTTLYDSATGQKRLTLPESGGLAAFSPDGQRLATGPWKHEIKLWNPVSGELVGALTNAGGIYALAFSPDSQTLAVCMDTGDNTWLYDLATGAQRKATPGIPCCTLSAAWSPDGQLLATADSNESVRLWDPQSSRQIACLLGHSFAVDTVAWSPDGKVLASAGNDATVRLWDVAAAKTVNTPMPGQVQPGFFSADGRFVALQDLDHALSVRELPSQRLVAGPRQLGQFVGFSKDDTVLLTLRRATNNQSAELLSWRMPELLETNRILLGPTGPLDSPYDLSPDGNLLATPGADGELQVWDLAQNGKLAARLTMPNVGGACAVRFTPDGRRLVATFFQAKAGYLWDLESERPAREFPGMQWGQLQFSHDGKLLFGNGSSSLTFWDMATGQIIGTSIGRWGGVNCLDLSPDGKTLTFYTRMGARFWNVVTRRECGLVALAQPPVVATAFGPDGNTLFITQQGPQGYFTTLRTVPSFAETDPAPAP